jgi:hypothetical protein
MSISQKQDEPMVIVVINRWDDDFALYRDYIDHEVCQVFYIVTEAGRRAIPLDLAAGVFEVSSSSYTQEELLAHCGKVIEQAGRIDRIIALSEYDLPKAAFLRSTLGVPGVTAEQAVLFTDKVAMKHAVTAAGLRAPRYQECKAMTDIVGFAAQQSYPLILKPIVGAASRGVHAVLSRTALVQLLHSIDIADYQCEEYIAGTVLHVDGIVHRGEIGYLVASRYINNCLAYNSGVPLGSVFIDDEALTARIRSFTQRVLTTLGLSDGAYHLELILSETDELVFLELNARVGGAEITFLMRDLFGIDLVGAWVQLQLSGVYRLPAETPPDVGGWLLVPEPVDIPCEAVACTSLKEMTPCLYKEILPAPGHRFYGDGGYENISGRFRFHGPSSAAVEQAIYDVLAAFRLDVRTLPH